MAESVKKKLGMKDVLKVINKRSKENGWDILSFGDFAHDLKKLSLGTLGFDLPFKGGLPYGQIVTFSGVEHSGKSTAAIIAMSQYQKENPDKVCVYVDAENTLLTQGDYFKSITDINYEPEHFLRYDCTGQSAEEIFQDLILMQETDDIGMIVIDSARALVSQADLDNEFTKDNGQRASISKPLGKFIKQMMMYLPKRNNILLIINQVTVEKTAFSTLYTEPCGYPLKYFPSLKIRFGTRTYTRGDKTDITQSKVDDSIDGIRLHFAIVKSRLGAIGKDGGFITIRYDRGVDTVFDLIEVGIKAGLIKMPTNKSFALVDLASGDPYTDQGGKQLIFEGRGKDDAYKSLYDYLTNNEKFRESYYEMLIKYISGYRSSVNLIDEGIISDLLAQENALCGAEHTSASDMADQETKEYHGILQS